jgi:hypothetical protein
MGNPGINNISPNTGRILDEYGGQFNIANFFESLCSGGYETGASGCSTDIHALTGIVNFNISADADVVNGVTHNVVVNVLGLTTGSLIAAAVQSAIQAIGGNIYAGITFTYANGVYNALSGSLGPGSKIRITAGTVTSGYSDLAAALKIGSSNGAVDTDGAITGLPVLLKPTPTIDIGEVQIGDPNTPSQKLAINAAGAASVTLSGSIALLQDNLTLTGAYQQLPNTPCRSITIQAEPTNGGFVYIGNFNTVSSANHICTLSPGSSVTILASNFDQVFVIGTAGDAICAGGEQ